MSPNISIVVPTRNRAYTLRRVVSSWLPQEGVTELIVVDDAGTDDTRTVVEGLRERAPHLAITYLRNEQRQGAAYSRMRGVREAANEFVLFCDDDDFLGPGYSATCRRKLEEGAAEVVSGRHFYRLPDEEIEAAIHRFGNGLLVQRPFDRLRFKVNTDARFEGDVQMPFTHGIFMTRRSLLLGYGLDAFYSKGNGFREESDVQMRAFLDGHRVLVTNEAHAVHLHPSEVATGGQRVDRFSRYYWTVYYTRYFFKKYFDASRKKLGIPYGQSTAMVLYALIEGYIFFIRPFVILPGRVVQALRR